jgi:hypothetical protein
MENQLLEDFIDFISECMIIQEDYYKKQLSLAIEISEFGDKNMKEI